MQIMRKIRRIVTDWRVPVFVGEGKGIGDWRRVGRTGCIGLVVSLF